MLLFENEVPVSESEVQEWLDTIPNLSAAIWRREAYRKAYHVDDKIRAAKKAGNWHTHQAIRKRLPNRMEGDFHSHHAKVRESHPRPALRRFITPPVARKSTAGLLKAGQRLDLFHFERTTP